MGHLKFFIYFFSLFGLLYAAVVPEDNNEVESSEERDGVLEEKWFEQYVNHFDVLDNRTFYQKYFEDDRYFKSGGPMLLEIGGEGVATAESLSGGQGIILASKLKGRVYLLEHRYYGNSTLFDNDTLTLDEWLYLSVDQALEDLAYFVETIKKTTPGLENSKVGVIGCSYSGALATWFRYKFPHLVDAAWASSGPLRAVTDFHEYFEVATEVYSNVSQKCYNVIKDGYQEAKNLLENPEGEQTVKTKLQNWGCSNISDMNADEILGNIRYILADHNVSPDHGTTSCTILEDEVKSSPFERLAEFLLFKSPDTCSEDDQGFPNDGVAWNYQTCTEFGYTLTTKPNRQPFNESSQTLLNDDVRICQDTFWDGFSSEIVERGVKRMNRVYGSTNLKATKVLSVHGGLDPWHKLGLYVEVTEDAPVIFIPGTSHCADQSNDFESPPQLVRAAIKARKIMTKWLK